MYQNQSMIESNNFDESPYPWSTVAFALGCYPLWILDTY